MYVWPYGSYTLFPSSNQLFPLGTEAPRALLSRGKHDIIKLSSSLSLSFSLSFLRCIYLPFSVSPLLFFISLPPSSPHPSSPRAEQSRAEQSRAERCSDIIECIWCKIRTPAKQVRDYLVMPPPRSWFKLNLSNGKMNPGQILINTEICDWYPTAIISFWKAWLSGCQRQGPWLFVEERTGDVGRLCWPDPVKTKSIFIPTYQPHSIFYDTLHDLKFSRKSKALQLVRG